MLQKKLFSNFNNPDASSIVINPDGSKDKLDVDEFSSSYHCLVVFRGDFEPISSYEILDFSKNVFKFQDMNCQVMGLVRDSSRVVDEWMVKPLLESKEENFVTFFWISSPELGKESAGLVQALGVPLVEGSPIPTIIISDKKSKVRYSASFNPNIPRSVEEALRVVAAIKMVGYALAPADWASSQSVIKNTKTGILNYYYKEKKYEVKNQETGLWVYVKNLFGVKSSKSAAYGKDRKINVSKKNSVNEEAASEESVKDGKIDDLKKKSVDEEVKINAPENSGQDGKIGDLNKTSVDKEANIDVQKKFVE